MGEPKTSQEELIAELAKRNLIPNFLIVKALSQSIKSHSTQKRDDGASYLEQHIFPVTMSVIDYCHASGKPATPELIAGALLHDTLEDDNKLIDEEFLKLFGDKVYSIVKPLSKSDYSLYPGETKKEKKTSLNREYYKILESAPEESKIIKLADRLNNILCIHLSPKSGKMDFCVEETEEYYLPFAEKISAYYYDRIKTQIDKLKS
jgi:guanosine-3',5'-bis(diphosphate) 3'-pyrophosphohydrolase